MADPKLPKQLSEESVLGEFTQTGNIYVDSAYTSQEAIDALGGTSSITGEALVAGTNALSNFSSNNGNSPSVNPEDDHAFFVSNLNRGTARGNGHDYFFNFSRNKALADIYITNAVGGDFSASPRVADNYRADSDGTLSVYIEGSTFGGNLMGFGSQTGTSQTFTGNYEFTFKKSQAQWFCITYGTGYGLGEGNAGNNRFGNFVGNIDLLVDGSTITNNGAILRGGINPGEGDEKAYLRAYIKDSLFQGEFGVVMTGVDGTMYKSNADVDITIDGSTFTNVFLMFPNVATNTQAANGQITTTGDVNFKVTNTRFSGLNMGAGLGGTGWNRTGWIKGNITFDISGSSNSSRTFVHKGFVGAADEQDTVTGSLTDSVFGDFTVFETRENNHVYADANVKIAGSTIGNFSFYNTINSGGGTAATAERVHGTQTLEFTGSTAGTMAGNLPGADQPEATFNLVFHASEAQSAVGAVSQWTTLTVDAGANVRATSIANVVSMTLNGANLLSSGSVNSVETLTVVDASLTKGEAILISGLSSFDEGNIGTVMINGTEFSYGMFGGQYEYIGGNLVAHLDPTYLVNNNYEGNNVDTGFPGVKGYKDLSVAQAAARANDGSLIFTTMDPDVDAPSFTEDIATLDVVTKFVGEEGDKLDLGGFSIIVGGDDAVASAAVTITHAQNINKVNFGAGTATGSITISEIGDDADTGIATLDLTGSAVTDASVTVSKSYIGDVKLSDVAAATGKITISESTIANVYGGAGAFENDLTGGNEIETVYAEGYGANMKFGTSTVETYIAGSNTEGAEFETLVYNDSVSAKELIIGGNANKIGTIDATIAGGVIEEVTVGNDGDTISGDVKLAITGGVIEDLAIAEDATLASTSKVEVTLGGGTVATSDGTFYGLIYGASVTGALDGGDQGASRTLTVDGYARIGSITNFDSIEVVGGTLNVESGDRKDDPTADNAIDIDGNIVNRRAIQAGAIFANDLDNHGLVGVLRSSADDPGIQLTGNFASDTFVRTSILTVDGNFSNSGEITSVGDITVDGSFTNYGQIYIRSSFDKDTSVFAQEGGIELNNVDMVNSGSAAFISTGFLKGVKNLTTNRLYVTGGADITGNITIEAGAEVAFTNKANPERADGLSFGGSISMYDTSNLIVSGTVQAGKTLTINTEDGLAGSNVLVKAEAGLDKWTISWGAGLSASSYGLVRTDSQIMIYSVDELIVNSAYASLEDGDEIKIDGNTYIKGLNAFGTVEDATYFAGTKGYDKARIVVYNDKSGMDVDTTYGSKLFDLTLVDSTVGAVTAKNIYVATNSTVKSIDAAASLTIDDSALLTVSDTIVDGLAVVIDAADGSGARKVIVVDPTKVTFADGQVTVQKPLGNDSYTVAFSETGDTVYLKANANIFLLAADAEIVDGVTVDKATGDVLFAGLNAFTVEADAAAAAAAVNGTLWIADGSNKIRAIAGVSDVALEYSGSSSIYGSEGDAFVSDQDYSVKIAGSVSSAKVYGLNKSVNLSGNYTFEMSDCNLTSSTSAIYIVGNDVNNVVDGDINAVLTNVRTVGRQDVPWGNGGWNEGIYLGYGSFGTNPDAPININVTLSGVTSTNSGFYGIQTQPSDGTRSGADDTSTSSTPVDQQVRQDINANINIKVLDSVIGGTFTVLNTNNEHWDANGASLLNTYFSSGSITVEVGNSDFGTEGNWRNIRLGASLQLGGKAIQEFNVPNTLHIVATDNGTTTRAAYINEWDTVIVDATAQLILSNDVQYATIFGPDQPLDDAGTLTQIMINMSGYKSGTHNVITAAGQIYTDSDLSNITVIGDNDLTGQCQLAYAFSEDGNQLKGIYIFDKADDMYVNATYTNAISGTKVAGQELLLNYNAYTDFGKALEYADVWGGSIIVTGGEFGSQDFHGLNAEISGATIASVTMAGEKQVRSDVTLTVKDGAVLGSVDGSNDKTDSSILEIAGNAQIDEIKDFDTVSLKKGVALELGTITGAGFNMYADNVLNAKSISFNGSEKITLDVTGYTDKSHAIISTEDGITGFNASMVELVAYDKGKTKTDLNNYSVLVVGNDLVLRNILKSDTYLNSEYTVATKEVLDDGTYIEYGLNAFSNADEAAANMGGQKYTLTVTGGEIATDIKLGGANFAMEEGTVNGVVYACVNTADKGGFYSGKTYTVTDGTIGGFDLTAGEGVYVATNSKINFGENITVTGNIIGGGDTIVTTEGNLTVNGLIMGVTELVLDSDGFISASGIDLGSGEGESTVAGTIRVNPVVGSITEGNRRLLIQTETDIRNVKFAEVAGGTVYSTGKQVYFLDLSRIYFDPTFTSEVDGKQVGKDTLLWGVNAFSNFNDAVSAARKNSATLYVQNGAGNINITGTPIVDLVVSGSTVPTMEYGLSGGQNAGSDNYVHVVIQNSVIANNNSYIMGQGAWNSRNTFAGTFVLDVTDSVIGGGRLRLGTFFNEGNKTYIINITDTEMRGDLNILEDSPFGANDSVTVNLTGVNAPVTKWWVFFDGYPNEGAGTITVNIKDSVLGDTSNGFRFALQRDNGTSNQFNGTKVTFTVENSTVNGSLQIEKVAGQDITFNGNAVLNVIGENYVRYALKFNEVNIAAGATITGSTMSLRSGGVINVDVTGYEGPTKDIVWMSTTLGGDLGEVTGLKEGYLVVKGSKAIVISDGNITNLYVDANYDSSITGSTSSAGDILIFVGDSSDENHANALTDLEDAKERLTAGNKLFVAASENELYGTLEDEDVTPFVNLVVTNGDFSTEGSIIAAANVDESKTVSGNSVIEIAGGSIGKAAVTHVDEETGEVIVDEPAVYAKISGTRAAVGGTSDLVISKVGGIYADVEDFGTMTVTSESRVHGTVTVDALAIDSTGFLTVDGTLDTNSIYIATAGYEGASKKVLVSDLLETISVDAIKVDEGGEFFLDRDNKTLWLVSTAPGNVYFNTGYTDDINGTTFNGDLLFLNTNAFTTASKDIIADRATSANTVYFLDGNFDTAALDLSGIGTRKLEFQGGSVGAVTVDAGSTVSVTGTTSAVTIASLSGAPVGEGEEVKEGYGVTLKPGNAANIATIDGVNYFRFNAANAANITVGQVDFLKNGGQFIVDFADYTIGDAAQVTLFTAANGVNNFIQYITPEEGEAYSRTVMETRNNGENLMVYYDETSNSVKALKRANAGILDANANNSVNGTTQVVGGVTNTLVYGFNVSESLTTIVNGLVDGDTLVVDGANRDLMVESKDLNAIITNSRIGSLQLGVTNNSSSPHTRTGNFDVLIEASTITARSALAGRGTASDSASTRVSLIFGEDVEGQYVGESNFTFKGGAYNDSGSTDNVLCITQYANVAGDTVNVNLEDYTISCDIHMFDNIWNIDGQDQLKQVNVNWTNVNSTASKWMWIWDPRQANATNINFTIKDSTFVSGNRDYTLGLFGDNAGDWSGKATVTISGFTMTGRLSGARGLNTGDVDVAATDDAVRTLVIDGENNVDLVKMFNAIEIADTGYLTGGTVSLVEGNNTGILILGEAGKDYGLYKTFINVSGAINNATGVKFVDKTDKETEIAGYTAVLGSTNVFVYKPGQLGDVFYSKQYDASVNGRAAKNSDGSDTVLVYGDNAVSKVADAYTALEAAGAGAVFQIQGANDTNLYTNGYKTLVNGGNITTLFGGNAPDTTDPENPVPAAPVASADITVNAEASVKNLTVASALSQVTGNAVVTIADGVGISGTIDGGEAYVGGTSNLVFAGAATAGTIVGFDTVTLNANDVVTLTDSISVAAITIDAADFTDFTKKVLTAKDITVPASGITIINPGANTFGYEIVSDGENKALLITSDLVKDTYANAAWTSESELGFVGDTALVFDKNAFNSAATAAGKVGEGNVLYIEGGAFAADAVTLENDNDVVVNGAAQIGALTTGGKLTANKALTVTSIDGVSNVAMVAGEAITVADGVALAADAKISIDVTGFTADADDVVVLSTTAGITIDKEGTPTVIDNSVLTVTGEGAGSYFAYYSTDDSSVHLLKLNTFYLSTRWEGGNNMPEFFEFTGEKLIYNVNAYDRMNASGAKMVDGQKFWAYYRNGSVHTGGPDMPEGQVGKFLNEVHVYGSNVDRIVLGGTNGNLEYNGDINVFVENSTICTVTDNESWLISNVTADNPWNNRNTLSGVMTVDIKNSTIGTADGNASALRIMDYTILKDTAATDTTPAKKAELNVTLTDTVVYNDIRFIGDSPMGGQDFSILNITLDNVTVAANRGWAIRGGGTGTRVIEDTAATDPVNASTVTVTMTDTTFGNNARFAIEDNWNAGGNPWETPMCASDFIFDLTNVTINGYLIAGRRDLGEAEADSDPELPQYTGNRVLNVNGSNYVKNAYYFKTVNLTGDSSLQGDTLHMYDGGTINVDLTDYAGPSRVIVALNFQYNDDGEIVGGGIENFNAANLTVTGLAEPAEGETPAYTVLTDFAENGAISRIVVKGGIKDVFVNSTYNEDDFEFGTAYKTGEAMFYGENAFTVMAGYEDPETAEWVAGALDEALKIDGTVLHITGGAVETDALLNNSITIDAGATLAYQGSTTITVNGTIQNNGNFVIDASGFVAGSPDRVTVLVADEILGNDIRVTTKAYAVEKTVSEETGKTEISLVLKADAVFVNTAWSEMEPGTEVIIDGTTAYIGYTAFADADTALSKVNSNGSISIIGSTVGFTNAVGRGITVKADGTSKIFNTTIGSDTVGALVLQAGAVGSAINLQGASTLTVEAGAKVTGGLGMSATATANFDNEATLDFYIVGQNKIEGPRVTNLSRIGASTPNFTVTIDAGIKDGAYQLASDAAAFNSSITLQTETKTYTDFALTLGSRILVDDFGAYFEIAIDDNNVLTLKKETSQDVIFVNSTWTDGQTVVIDGTTVTVGENGFTTGDAAVTKAVSSGATTIKVVGGTASFTDGVVITTLVQNAELAETNVTGTLTVSETSTLSGTFAFAPAEGKTITVNGTVAFDTVNTTATIAQITDLSKAAFGDSAKFTLKVTGEVQSGDVFLLATGAEGFASTISLVGSDVVLAVGETQKVGNLGYRLTLTDGNLALNITDKPVPAVVFVNSTWTANDGDTVVISDTVSATMGYDAFKNGNAAYSAVASDGEIVVLGGTVNFSSAIEKNLTINDGATLVGKNAFAAGKTITINGTVLFDTQYAATVQIGGLANTTGTAKFELVDTVSAEGDYLLASDAAGFTATVKFGDNDLTVGGPVVEIDDLNYTLAINDNNDLVLSVTKDEPPVPVAPTQTYANSEWSSLTTGAVVAVTGGTAIIGTDAFATLSAAISAASDDGKINVTGGTVTFANGYSKTITVDAGATVVGKAAFDAAITINGTVVFDTALATATAAQITGFNLIGGDAKFALTDAASGTDTKTYRLASDVVSFNKSITVEGQALTLEQSVKVNDYEYSLALEAGNLTLTVAYVEPPTPTEFVTKSDIDGNGISDVLFVWTGNNYQQGYWMNGTSEWYSANAAHPSDWIPLGAHDMNNNGKADSVMFGNVWTETSGKGAYIGYYIDADDASTVEHPTWQNIGYLNNEEDVTWQNCVGNLNGEKNSIVWYAPDLYATGIWVGVDEYPEWIPLSASFGGPDWNLVGCGDFDGDGKQSVVMNYNNGQFLYTVDIDGNTKSLGDLQWIGWQLRAIGDFAGDGKDDIVLFHEQTGTMVMCYDGNLDNYAAIGQLAFDDWFVVGAGDYNGDKKDDLLVRQYSTGMLGYYSTGDTNQWVELGRGVDMQWTVIA